MWIAKAIIDDQQVIYDTSVFRWEPNSKQSVTKFCGSEFSAHVLSVFFFNCREDNDRLHSGSYAIFFYIKHLLSMFSLKKTLRWIIFYLFIFC